MSRRRPNHVFSLHANFPVGTFPAYLAEHFGEYADTRLRFVIIRAG
ncbi:hypothetical protein [Streptomyces sp. NPDC057557]